MNVLELFAGSRSVGKAAEELGYKVYSSDINDFPGIDYVVDVLEFDLSKIPFKPDIIWASPPCTAFSVIRIGHNWHFNNEPKTEDAVLGMKLVVKTIEIIKELKPKYWFMENPRGKLRKLKIVEGLPRTTVWYCRYGDSRAKPTDIWSNHIYSLFNPNGWNPRPQCWNGNKHCHHEESPRGQTVRDARKKGIEMNYGGTANLANNYERSKIPHELCLEVLKSCNV